MKASKLKTHFGLFIAASSVLFIIGVLFSGRLTGKADDFSRKSRNTDTQLAEKLASQGANEKDIKSARENLEALKDKFDAHKDEFSFRGLNEYVLDKYRDPLGYYRTKVMEVLTDIRKSATEKGISVDHDSCEVPERFKDENEMVSLLRSLAVYRPNGRGRCRKVGQNERLRHLCVLRRWCRSSVGPPQLGEG